MAYQSKRKPLFPMERDGVVVLADRDCEQSLLDMGFTRAKQGTRPTGGAPTAGTEKEEEVVDREALAELSKDQLKDLLHANGLDQSGNKPDLIERLVSNGIGPTINVSTSEEE